MLAAHGLFYFAPCNIAKTNYLCCSCDFLHISSMVLYRPWLLDAARVLSRTGFFIFKKK